MTPFLRACLLGTAAFLTSVPALAQQHCAAPGATQANAPGVAVTPTAPDISSHRRLLTDAEIDDAPGLHAVRASGAKIYDSGVMDGMPLVLAVSVNPADNVTYFQAFHLSPTRQVAVRGVGQDSKGRNLTLQMLSDIPGILPTVKVTTDGAATPPSTAAAPLAEAVAGAQSGSWGDPSAPLLHVFVDPKCAYSVQAAEALRPYVAAGRVRVALVPIAIRDAANGGASTSSALSMLSTPREQMAEAWLGNSMPTAPSPAAREGLKLNADIAASHAVRGTPTFVWKTGSGNAGRMLGLPADFEALIAALKG